jgi:hypothetical protein
MQSIVIHFDVEKVVLKKEKNRSSHTLCDPLDDETGYKNKLPTILK